MAFQALNITLSLQKKDLHNGHVDVWNPLQLSSPGAAYLLLRCYQLPRKDKDKSQLLYPVGMQTCSRTVQNARADLCLDVSGSHGEDRISPFCFQEKSSRSAGRVAKQPPHPY